MCLINEKKLKQFRQEVGPTNVWNDPRIKYTGRARGQQAYRLRLVEGYCMTKDERARFGVLGDEVLIRRASKDEFAHLLYEAVMRGADEPAKQLRQAFEEANSIPSNNFEMSLRSVAGATLADILRR